MHSTHTKNTKLQEEWRAANTVDTSTATDEKSKADILFHTHLGSMVPDFYLQAG
jgi:hypothetical protein